MPLYRILRGGSYCLAAAYCRSAFREKSSPGYRSWDWGFRPVASAITGVDESDHRVFRGGSFWYAAISARNAARNQDEPEARGSDLGFRPVADSRGPAVQKPE
jgi:formylglycine-generating enzyme required for sulfatase activity